MMYQAVQIINPVPRKLTTPLDQITERCLAAFTAHGTLDVSLDRIAREIGLSKRMLIHYFGGREALEERAVALLEQRLRTQLAPVNFSSDLSLAHRIDVLWTLATRPESAPVLRLVMDLMRRAWNGSARARRFYMDQRQLWMQVLAADVSQSETAEDLVHVFQGAVLVYLVTGDAEPGRRMLKRFEPSALPRP